MKRLFNMWKIFSKKKPKQDGWYLCTVETVLGSRHVEELYWYGEIQKFKNKKIFDLINEYDVYKYNDATHKYDISVNDCIETNKVIAWKMKPKAYIK